MCRSMIDKYSHLLDTIHAVTLVGYIAVFHGDLSIHSKQLHNILARVYNRGGRVSYFTMILCYNSLSGSCMTFVMIFTKKVVSHFVPVHHMLAVVTVPYRLASMPTNSMCISLQRS